MVGIHDDLTMWYADTSKFVLETKQKHKREIIKKDIERQKKERYIKQSREKSM